MHNLPTFSTFKKIILQLIMENSPKQKFREDQTQTGHSKNPKTKNREREEQGGLGKVPPEAQLGHVSECSTVFLPHIID